MEKTVTPEFVQKVLAAKVRALQGEVQKEREELDKCRREKDTLEQSAKAGKHVFAVGQNADGSSRIDVDHAKLAQMVLSRAQDYFTKRDSSLPAGAQSKQMPGVTK